MSAATAKWVAIGREGSKVACITRGASANASASANAVGEMATTTMTAVRARRGGGVFGGAEEEEMDRVGGEDGGAGDT